MDPFRQKGMEFAVRMYKCRGNADATDEVSFGAIRSRAQRADDDDGDVHVDGAVILDIRSQTNCTPNYVVEERNNPRAYTATPCSPFGASDERRRIARGSEKSRSR